MLRPLVLTGGPAVGKSTTARLVARARPRAALVDVDDIRQLVVSGHAAPWQGAEGLSQQRLGVENACLLALRLHPEGFNVVLSDVLTQVTAELYRARLPGCLVVRLYVTWEEARRRAGTRPAYLTDAEFDTLHAQDRESPPAADHHLDVTAFTVDDQATAVLTTWSAGR